MYPGNTVYEETRFQVVGSVPALKKEHMVPLLLKIIKQYPFKTRLLTRKFVPVGIVGFTTSQELNKMGKRRLILF